MTRLVSQPQSRSRLPRLVRRIRAAVPLACVLALAAVLVPDAAPSSEQVALVKVKRATSVDISPEVIWVLAVGSDARPGEEMTRARGDALQLVGMNTKTGAATSIGIPRDSWVPIPGHGSNRVNAALNFGGPELLGETVGDMVGVQPDYVFVTRFPFFENMVDDIGGIDLRNPYAFSDSDLLPNGIPKGKVHLNGYRAMAYARIRKTLPNGDFGRSAHQQDVIAAIQRKIRARAQYPGFIERGVHTVMKHMHTDLPPAELFRLAQAIAQVDPGKVTGCVVQGGIGNVGGASVVLPNTAAAKRYGDDARRDAVIQRC